MAAQSNEPPLNAIEQIKIRLAAHVPQLQILQHGDFCDSPTFLESLVPVTLDIVAKISASEPSVYQSEICSRRSESDLIQSIQLNSVIALESSIALGSVAVKYLQRDDPNRGIVISMFARALWKRWQLKKEEDVYLDQAIYYFQKTIKFEPVEEPNRPLHFDDLGCALRERYRRRHEPADFDAAKLAFESAAAIPHPGEPMFLSNLGKLLRDKALFSEDGKQALLEKSLDSHLAAIACVTPEYRGVVRTLYRLLVETYLDLYPVLGDNPVENIVEKVEETVAASGKRWMFLSELGCSLGNKFIAKGQHHDAKNSVLLLRAALKESPGNQVVMSALVDILERQGISLQSQEILTEAHELSELIINSMDEGNPELLPRLQSDTMILTHQFEYSGRLEDLTRAISLTRRALASPLLGTRKWKFQQILGVQLGYLFQKTEKKDDLEVAIASLQAAVEVEGLPPVDKAASLREYGKVLFARFRFNSKKPDLDDTIKAYNEAIELWGQENISIVSCMNDLANALLSMFEMTADPEHIRQAIDSYLATLATLERFPLASKDKAMYYVGLGNAFFTKFDMWNQAADLNQAIVYYKEAVTNTDQASTLMPLRVGRLSRALQQQFRVTQNTKLLETAEESLKQVLSSSPSPSSQEISFLQNILGILYLQWFDASDNDLSFFDKAAESFRAAMDSGCTQPVHVNPPAINLMRTFLGKYEYTKDEIDLQKAGAQMSKLQTLISIGANRGEIAGVMDTMGKYANTRYRAQKSEGFGQMAILFYQTVLLDNAATPERRLSASLHVARLSYEVLDKPVFSRIALTTAINLLPHAILSGPNRGDHLRAAKLLSPLPGLVIAFSLAAGDTPSDAVRLFEKGRTILWNRLLDSKTSLHDLHAKHPELATDFERLRESLDRVRPKAMVTEEAARGHILQQELALQYNATVQRIRQQKGFKDFLLLEQSSRLPSYAAHGPIVILNTTQYRGDAILITTETVSSLSLPQFIFYNCNQEGAKIKEALAVMSSDPERASTLLTSALKWLWDAAAKPVLDQLGIDGTKGADGKLPRIWWIINGWTSLFPIHAAGDHSLAMETGEPCTVMDRAISSYTPTLRLLDHVRKSVSSQSSLVRSHPRTAVLIKMPTTFDEDDLPNASNEVDAVEGILHPTLQVTTLDCPKRKDVLAHLQVSSMAHFACHGVANALDPSLSQLKLYDWKTAPLDVRTLTRSPYTRLKFVYLSACESAMTKAQDLQEESVHLSAGFQAAGVPYAVATLWKIEDELSVEIARSFYSHLTGGSEEFDFSQSAEALHSSVLRARNRGVDALLWGAFVHFGA